MNNLIGIINYGVAGNIHSVQKAILKAGGRAKVINQVEDFKSVDKLVIPGVGSFKDAMKELENSSLVEQIKNFTGPVLGICLGMQILATIGFEFGETNGLNMVDGEVKKIMCSGKVPHVGFNKISVKNPNLLLKGVEDEEFYFMHSFEMVNYTDVASLTNYYGHNFVSSINRRNIYGVQFHPEKSRKAGLKLLSNFINLK